MPSNPDNTEDGLVSQGWNWTLNEAQEYVEKYGLCEIGQLYDTNDGQTWICIDTGTSTSIAYGFSPKSGTMTGTVYWGDGTSTTINSSSIVGGTHTYSEPGKYIVKINDSSECIRI